MKKIKRRLPKPGRGGEDHLPGAGGPAGGSLDRLGEVLGDLGYDLGQEEELQWGMIAWNVAVLVHHEAIRGSGGDGGRRNARAGRNAPCPCGSGRKHKTCCLNRKTPRAASPAAGAALREVAPPHPRIVPYPTRHRVFRDDMARLVRLFEEEPALRDVRYPADAVTRFLATEIAEEQAVSEDSVDAMAFRFVASTGLRLPDDLQDRLLALAPRHARDLDALRALAVGTILAIAGKQPEIADSNLLVPIVFRLTVSESVGPTVRGLHAIEALGLGDLEIDPDGAEGATDEAKARVARALAQADRGTLDEIVRAGEAMLAPLVEAISSGRFPVAMPLASLLPLLVELYLDPTLRDPKGSRKLGSVVVRVLDGVGPEDMRLFAAALEGWLEEHPEAEERAQVEGVLRLARANHLGPLLPRLLLAAGAQGPTVPLPGEAALAEGLADAEGRFDAAGLEAYGDLLFAEGFPAVARRTWRLYEKFGPLPASVQRKLGNEDAPAAP